MAIDARIRELTARHRALEDALHTEMKRPLMDVHRVTEMKKAKLRIKDELSALSPRA